MISTTANKLSRHLFPLGAQEPSRRWRAFTATHAHAMPMTSPELPLWPAWGREGLWRGWVSCTDVQILWIKQQDFSRAYLVQPDSHLEQLFALYREHLSSSFVCFLNFCANVFILGAQLLYSPALFLFFSPTTYKFLKIRNFNGSADSAWTLLYQHGVHWKDEIKGL